MYEAYDFSVEEKEYRPFLGVAISGGGSRAANFGMYVLKELQRLGVLDRVDAISSVSGGSIIAAHFGLYYPWLKDGYWRLAEKDMSQDFRDDWLARHANPKNWKTLYKPGFNASTMLAETYDSMLFHGATFLNFGPPGKGRPHILINSTIVGAPHDLSNACLAQEGNAYSQRLSTFVFSDLGFIFCLGSDLGTYSIAQAVAASSAFPLLFSPVALKVYPFANGGGQKYDEYIHVMDGGASDNLGTDALVMTAVHRWRDGLNQQAIGGSVDVASDKTPCFLIVVDAFVDDGEKLEEDYPDIRKGLFDRIVDPSWHYAIDALMQRRRSDALRELGIDLEARRNSWGDYVRSVARQPIALREAAGQVEQNYGSVVFMTPNTHQFACGVWHISLRDAFSVDSEQLNSEKRFDRATLYGLVTSIKTDLKLTGAQDCKRETYQEGLADAAKILVREDGQSLAVLHDWLNGHGWVNGEHWTPDVPGTNGRRFPVTGARFGPLGTPSGVVRCIN